MLGALAMQTKTLTIQLNNEQLPILPVEPEAYLSFATLPMEMNWSLNFRLRSPRKELWKWLWSNMASAQIWIRMRMEALAPWQMSCGSPLSGISGGIDGRCDQ